MLNKEQSIKWLNALNNSCSIVSSTIQKMVLTETELKERVEVIANWLYQLEPREEMLNSEVEKELEALFPYKDLEERIKNANTKEELLALTEEVKKVEKESQKRVFEIYNDKKIKLK